MRLKEIAYELKKKLTAIFLALKKKETPLYAKVVAGITLGYYLSPIDLIPDFIPIVGYLDDLIIVPIMIFITIKLIPKEIMKVCLIEAKEIKINKKWYFAIPIVLLWVIILVFIIKSWI